MRQRAPASPVGAFFSSSIAFQVRHLVQFTQEFLTSVHCKWAHRIQSRLVKLIQDLVPLFRIGQSFQGLSFLHLPEDLLSLNSENANRAEKYAHKKDQKSNSPWISAQIHLRDDRAPLGRRTHGEMDRFLQEVTDEAHFRALIQREVCLTEHPPPSFREGREG